MFCAAEPHAGEIKIKLGVVKPCEMQLSVTRLRARAVSGVSPGTLTHTVSVLAEQSWLGLALLLHSLSACLA